MGLLLKGVQFHPATGAIACSRAIAASFIAIGKARQGGGSLPAKPLSHQHSPVLKCRAAFEGEPLQEIASVEGDCLLQLGGCRPISQHVAECLHVDPVVALLVELDRLARDEQEGLSLALGRLRIPISKGASEGGQGMAQAAAGTALGMLWPEQTGQALAAEGAIGLYSEVNQQGTRLVVAKRGDGRLVQRGVKGSQER